MSRLIDRLLQRRTPPDDERVRQDAEVVYLTAKSAATLRRAEHLIRLARVDAEMAAGSAKQRVAR